MYLKSLELQGFKSFPDKIRLTFDEGLTAVVGPNGSGKSNIGDAVRWVLGEQSTKELRGKSMEDVIFSGSAARRAMGFAAVTLTIDNADGALPVPEPEVAVTRRLFRSGESEYLINGRNVRLRDVNELFMDTGIGRDGYAIIGQGRIAEIVGAKSSERRDIFEEAAGVSKFRYKKQEAERRLAAAQDNLSRLTDIMQELESRIGPLKAQAEKAERYLVLAQERRTLEVSFWVHRIAQQTAQFQKLSDTCLQLTAECENLENDLQSGEERLQLAFQDMQQATADIELLHKKIVTAEQENAGAKAAIAVCENDMVHSSERIAALTDEIAEIEESGGTFEQKLAEQDALIRELAARLTALQSELDAETETLRRMAEENTEKTADCSRQDTALRQQYLEQNALQTRADGIAAELAETQETLRRAEEDSTAAEARVREYEQEHSRLEKALAALQKKQQEQRNRIDGFKALSASREAKYQQSLERGNALNSEVQKHRQRLQILTDLEQSMEGYAGSVRQVLRAAGSGRLGGVHGTVSQRIAVEPQYGTAIETALGGALQNIIVENEDIAKRCIRFLKESGSGRATFLPLTTIRGGRLNEPLDGVEGFIALACDLAGYDEMYRNIMERLLGRIAVAEDLDAASRIARQFQYRFRIVTLDGQVVQAGGSYTGGSAARSAGVITRTHEIEETAQKLKQLEQEMETLRGETAKRKAEWAKAVADTDGAKGQLREDAEAEQKLRQELAALEARASADAAWRENEALQRTRFQEKIDQLTASKQEAEQQLKQLAAEIAEAESALRADSETQVKLHSEIELRTGQLSTRRIRQAELAKDLESERSKRISMAKNMEQASERVTVLQGEIRKEKDSIAAKKKEIAHLTGSEETRRAHIQEMQADTERLRREHEQKEQHTRELQQGMDALRDARGRQEAERSRAEEKRDGVQREIDDLVFKLQDSYELTRTEAEAEAEPLENVREAETRLSSVKGKIRALGAVNVAAVDEYREVSERAADMGAQIQDVEKAKHDLEELIAQLTEDMCRIFAESFAEINRNFGDIFVDLFGGGKASLELTEPDNVLESGIEIKVEPPGKVIKNLSLLSGGEQAFVAICIYFAILRLRPAPFCILDEIDAALDEVNVRRYAQYLKAFFGQVQFVVVTHRRSAMEEANVLYGVTMQEDGVSRLLRLDQNGMALQMPADGS